jgi:hypothetical protein
MAKHVAGRLTARTVATAKAGRHADGLGLYLAVSETGARKWVYRFTIAGRVSEMGLGSGSAVTLAEARATAAEQRKLLAAGVNPLDAKRKATAFDGGKPTFGEVADAVIASKSAEWRNPKEPWW